MGNNGRFLVLIARRMTVVAVSIIALNCGNPSGEKQEGSVQRKSIEVVQNEHADALMSIPFVVGTAIGECGGKPCIKVLVSRNNPELLKKIPSELEGYQISIEETGELRRLDSH